MKTYLVENPNAELGYELKIVNDDGQTTFQPIKGFAKDGSIHLDPSNPSGREWVTKAKMDKSGGELELLPREKRESSTTKAEKPAIQAKGWSEYLTEEERAIVLELKEKALKRKKIADIKAQIEVLKAMLPEEEE